MFFLCFLQSVDVYLSDCLLTLLLRVPYCVVCVVWNRFVLLEYFDLRLHFLVFILNLGLNWCNIDYLLLHCLWYHSTDSIFIFPDVMAVCKIVCFLPYSLLLSLCSSYCCQLCALDFDNCVWFWVRWWGAWGLIVVFCCLPRTLSIVA